MQARPGFYREVHKGIRSFLMELNVSAGRVEWSDPSSVEAFRGDVEATFRLLRSHAHHENRHVAPLLEKAAPEVAKILGGNHDDQEKVLDELQAQLEALDSRSPEAEIAGHRFVVALSRFTGESLVHMADEEEVAMTAMWNAFDDAAILEAHDALVGSIPPDEMAAFLRWMIPAMNGGERAAFIGGLRASAPPPVFAFVRALAAEVLSPAQDAALAGALGEARVA